MESESDINNITIIDPTRRIVKYLSKCLIELIKHAESIQYKNDKIVNYDVHSTVNNDTDNKLDINEHNIKADVNKEGGIFKQINRMKQHIVELLTICSQQNILIDYDTTKPHFTIYNDFDDPKRILVMNHLTLHILSIVENTYLSIKFFKSSKYNNGQQIKKTFSNIYKEIKSLPMHPDILYNMDSSFVSLTHKSEYKDSYNYLVEKLDVLCKYISKFNKTYSKKYGFNDFAPTEDSTDDDNNSKKKLKKQLQKSYIESEINNINNQNEQEFVFKTPESRENNKSKQSNERRKNDFTPTEDSTDDDNNSKKKLKKQLEKSCIESEINNINNQNEQESVFKTPESRENNKSKKSNERRKKTENKINNHTDHINNENSKNISERDLMLEELLNDTINEYNLNSENNNHKIKEKSKHNTKHKINGNKDDFTPMEDTTNDNNSKKRLKKQFEKVFIKSEFDNINIQNDQESVLKSSEFIEINKSKQSIKRKKKTENKINHFTDNSNEDNSKNITFSERELLLEELLKDTINEYNLNSETNKIKKKNKTNGNKDDVSKQSKRKRSIENNVENEEESSKKRRKKHKLNNVLNNTETNNISNNIDEELNNLLSQYNNTDGEFNNLLNQCKSTDGEFEKSYENFECEDSDDDDDENYTISADVLNAIRDDNIEIDYDNKEFLDFAKIIKEHNLNENEKFLYIQDLLDTIHTKLALTEEKKEKLRSLNILVDWEVPPAHLACSNLSAGPNEEEKILLAKVGVTGGQYSAKEDEIIRNNWKEFCEKHDLEDDPSPFMILVLNKEKLLSYTERRKFLQYIGRGLPHKTLHSIFRRFKSLYKPKVKYGRFTPEEDELILIYVNKIKRRDNGQKFSRLAPLLHRHRGQIERRYRVLKTATQNSQMKIYWNLSLKEKFLKNLLEETHSKSIEDLRDKYIDHDLYNLIGQLMDIPPAKLKVHWIFRLHTELFATEPINLDLIKIKLIKKFFELKYDDWKTIDWKLMRSMFNGFTKPYLWITLKNLINDKCSGIANNLRASIDHLYINYLPILEQRVREGKEHILPRLRYENGILEQYK